MPHGKTPFADADIGSLHVHQCGKQWSAACKAERASAPASKCVAGTIHVLGTWLMCVITMCRADSASCTGQQQHEAAAAGPGFRAHWHHWLQLHPGSFWHLPHPPWLCGSHLCCPPLPTLQHPTGKMQLKPSPFKSIPSFHGKPVKHRGKPISHAISLRHPSEAPGLNSSFSKATNVF